MIIEATAVRRFRPFDSLSDEEAAALREILEPVTLAPGETLFRQEDPGASMYLLVDGQVEVRVATDHEQDRVLATLEPGTVLGELGLLLDEPRNATILAVTDATLWRITRDGFYAGLDRGDRWATRLVLTVARELAQRFVTASGELHTLIRELQRDEKKPESKIAELGRLRTRLLTE